MMRGILLVFSLGQPGGPPDRWLGRDKLKHFVTSAFVQSLGYGMLRGAGVSHSLALAGATLSTATVGVGKEVWDAQGHGTPSAKDLVWDAAGAGTATLLLVRTAR